MANDELDPRLAELLDGLKSVPDRDHRAALRGKNKFLAEAVSLSENRRQGGWTMFLQQRRKFAVNFFASVLAVAGLLFGGTATVYAAQDALPTDTLYQVKLFGEDAQLFFNTDPAAEVELLMAQAQTRTREMVALNEQGVTPPDTLMTHAQERIDRALQIASTLDETEVPDALLEIRDQLHTQDRLLGGAQDGHCPDCQPILRETRDMLRTHLDDVEDGLTDPKEFIHRRQNGNPAPEPSEAPVMAEPTEAAPKPVSTQEPIETGEPMENRDPANCQQESCEPALDGTGQQSIGTPVPQQQQQPQPQPQQQQGGDGQSPEPGGPPEPQKEPGGQQPPPPGQPGEGGRP